MLEERKVLVYPFDRGFSPLVRYSELLHRKARFNSLVSPRGFALAGHDAGYTAGMQTGMITGDDLRAVEDNDVFLAANGPWGLKLRRKIIESMAQAADMRKEIWCALPLSDEELADIRELCRQNDTEFIYFYHSADETDLINVIPPVYRPKSAVIFVGEVLPGLDAYAAVLSLYKSFSDAGYRACAVGYRTDCELFGIHSMPGFLWSSTGEDMKIYGFNKYIRELEEKEAADITIIQLPGALLKYNSHFINGGGVLSYIISQALQPDYMIACVPFESKEPESFTALSETFLYKFGFGIDFIHMSNARVNYTDSMQSKRLTYDYPDMSMVAEELLKYNANPEIPVCNILDGHHRNLFEHAEGKLTGYASAVSW